LAAVRQGQIMGAIRTISILTPSAHLKLPLPWEIARPRMAIGLGSDFRSATWKKTNGLTTSEFMRSAQ
jgi:hypothetical protein